MLLKKNQVYVFPGLVLKLVFIITYCQENKNITFVVVFLFCKSFLYHNSLFLKEINETANFLTENFLIL